MARTDSIATSRACEILDWDSEFFERRIARFSRPKCTIDDAEAVLRECAEAAIDCLYFLIDASDSASIAAVQDIAGRFVDVRITLSGDPRRATRRPAEGNVTVRSATDSDIPTLVEIAAVSHRDTRFYADGHFPRARCDRMYEVWIDKSCHGWADVVLVADAGTGRPAGYVTCHDDGDGQGHIGLFAVRPDVRGRGIGALLLRGGLNWFSERHVTSMTVATQGRNVGALQLYLRGGLSIRGVELWFHRWSIGAVPTPI